MTILAGGSITASNVAEVVRASGVREVHVRAAACVESPMRYRRSGVTLARPQAPGDYERIATRADEVARVAEPAKVLTSSMENTHDSPSPAPFPSRYPV